jgi:hypothetical protein
MTATGFVVGTPQYMSPEQALGQGDLDARSDLYAMGAMLFQMVTGTPPFDGATSQEIVGKHLADPVPVPSEVNAKIPRWLSDIIVRCLAKRPADRFQSAAMVLDALAEGRRTGPQETISAQRVAQRIQAAADTQRVASTQRPAPGVVVSGAATGSGLRPGRIVLFGLIGLAAILVLQMALGRPTLVVENRLVDPIRLAIENQTLEVAAGGRLQRKVPRGQQLVLHWYLVRPTAADGQPLGNDMQGTVVVERPRGRLLQVIDARATGTPFFTPLISNASSGPLGIRVNVGSAAAVDCGCSVPSGSTRAHLGYYPLFLNSAVQATSANGKTATFRDLGPQVDRAAGTVGLKFQDKDFQ